MAKPKIIKRKNVRDYYEIALEVGIDTTGGISSHEEDMKDIKVVSSDELESFRSILKECDNNSKKIYFDE